MSGFSYYYGEFKIIIAACTQQTDDAIYVCAWWCSAAVGAVRVYTVIYSVENLCV